METLNEKQGKHCPNIKKGGMLCALVISLRIYHFRMVC